MPLLIALVLAIVLVIAGVSILGAVASLVWYAIIGLVVGAIARLLVPGDQQMGWFTTILAGIAGAFGGALLADALNVGDVLQFVISVGVAALLVAVMVGSEGRDKIGTGSTTH